MPSKKDQQNFWSFYPSKPFKNGHFNVGHPVDSPKTNGSFFLAFFLFGREKQKSKKKRSICSFFGRICLWCHLTLTLLLAVWISYSLQSGQPQNSQELKVHTYKKYGSRYLWLLLCGLWIESVCQFFFLPWMKVCFEKRPKKVVSWFLALSILSEVLASAWPDT